MIIPASAKMFGWAFAGVCGLAIAGWINGKYTGSIIDEKLKIAGIVAGGKRLDSVKAGHDSGYRVDTLWLGQKNAAYQPLRAAARANPTDTVAVRRALNAADTAIKACLVVVAACEQRVKDRDAIIANRDSLVRELRKPPRIPRFTYDIGGLYDPMHRESVLRTGAEFRAFFDFSARAEGEYNDVRGFALRVGIRKVF